MTTLHAGHKLAEASAAVILIHGRGATADSILRLAGTLDPDGKHAISWLAPQAPGNSDIGANFGGVDALAPQAPGNSWYPYPFLKTIEANEPHRSRALTIIDDLIEQAEAAGIPLERIGLIGFSQGACLSLEYAGWGERQPGFVGALSGGVMGPLDEPRSIPGDRTRTDLFIGCGDRDGHIPLAHAERSAKLFQGAGATVDYREYAGMSHTINNDEVEALRTAMTRLAGGVTEGTRLH